MEKKIILFFSKTCEPCSLMRPVVHKVSNEMGIIAKEIDDESKEGMEKTKKYKITGFPTVLIVVDGIIRDVVKGYATGASEEINRQALVSRINAINE